MKANSFLCTHQLFKHTPRSGKPAGLACSSRPNPARHPHSIERVPAAHHPHATCHPHAFPTLFPDRQPLHASKLFMSCQSSSCPEHVNPIHFSHGESFKRSFTLLLPPEHPKRFVAPATPGRAPPSSWATHRAMTQR